MASFDDWLAVTDPRVFAESLAERFRLSGQELQRANDALAPAFALGFQRAMADPAAWSDLSSAFWGMVPGFSPVSRPATGARPGEIFTRAFFDSDALAAAVARQASLVAGIAPDTVEKLMPGLAMLTMQTMARATMDGMGRNAPEGWTSGDFGAASAEMMRRGANAVEALSRPSDARPTPGAVSGAGLPGAFAEALRTTLSMMQPAGARPEATTPAEARKPAVNPMAPFAALFDAFAQTLPRAPGAADTPAGPPPTARTPEDGPLGGRAETGGALHKAYAQEMAALFERYAGERKAG